VCCVSEGTLFFISNTTICLSVFSCSSFYSIYYWWHIDIVITINGRDSIQCVKQYPFHRFQTKDMGCFETFSWNWSCTIKGQHCYFSKEICTSYFVGNRDLDFNPVVLPMRPNTKLVAYQGRGELFLDHGRYKRLVVKLNYLIVTRPDISFVVIVVKCEPNSQFAWGISKGLKGKD
jgi:hypothetical protein